MRKVLKLLKCFCLFILVATLFIGCGSGSVSDEYQTTRLGL